MEVEEKICLHTSSGTRNITTSVNGVYILEIAQGTDWFERVGRKINIKRIQVRGYAAPDLAWSITQGGTPVQMFKVAVVVDWQNNGNSVPPFTSDIWNTVLPLSFPDPSFDERFTILWEKHFLLDVFTFVSASGSCTAAGTSAYFECDLDVDFDTIFLNTSGTQSNVATGSVFIYITSDQLAADQLRYTFSSRIVYTDD